MDMLVSMNQPNDPWEKMNVNHKNDAHRNCKWLNEGRSEMLRTTQRAKQKQILMGIKNMFF